MKNIKIIDGGVHEDARGSLRFVNDFDLTPVKRFYTISNSEEQPQRGWIGHKRETKWFFPLRGKTTISVEPMGTWECFAVPEFELLLDADEPKVLMVPPGNWFCITQDDGAAEVQIFSNCFVGEFKDDDFRRPL